MYVNDNYYNNARWRNKNKNKMKENAKIHQK